ncbi:MAG: aldo/keto reductase [Firmicutes bacterium]|nr:aldo/keto reductase [Bacillota bacterium]
MRTIPLGKTGWEVPAVAVGCMRMNRLRPAEAERYVGTALELGLNFFDHADIYGAGECESIFGRAYTGPRENIFLQSKCGIRKGRYDFSKEHILASVEGSLARLGTDYLDVLLLHRPDALAEPEEVAEAFGLLQASGKVRQFGVSNHSPAQIQLLQKAVRQPLVANQLQFGLGHAFLVSQGTHVNMGDDAAAVRDGGALDFCRLHNITVQPWSPFQYGMIRGPFIGDRRFKDLNAKLEELAKMYDADATAVALAWILRHPAGMQPVVGTMDPGRLASCAKAAEITLTREDWYALFLAAGNTLP